MSVRGQVGRNRVTEAGWRRLIGEYWLWLPVLFAVIYLAIFATDLRSDVNGIYASSDLASALSIGQLYPHAGPHAVVTLGNILWFPALFLERATSGLPAHREIWEGAPYVISLIAIGLNAWMVRRASSAWAAAMTTIALVVASPILVTNQFGFSVHALTYALVAPLGCFLVASVESPTWIGGSPIVHGALAVTLAALSAVGFASDQLFIVAGALPFLLTALALAWLRPHRGRRTAISAGGILVLGGIAGVVLHRAVLDAHIVPATFPITFAADNELLAHTGLLFESGFQLFSGQFQGQTPGAVSVLEFLCALVVIAAITIVTATGCRAVRSIWRRPSAIGVTGSDARLVVLTFWGLVALLTSLGYVVTSVSIAGTERYVVPAAYGIVIVLVVLADREQKLRAAVVVGVSLLALTAVVESARHELRPSNATEPTVTDAHQLARVLRAEHLHYGYAGYWTAAPLTWFMNGAASVYPVDGCAASLCPFYLHTISSWYTPRPHTRSFLISDPTQPLNPSAPARLGTPQAVLTVGHFKIDVYGYDIASRFG